MLAVVDLSSDLCPDHEEEEEEEDEEKEPGPAGFLRLLFIPAQH